MVAEYRMTTPTPRRSRKTTRAARAEPDYAPSTLSLAVSIRALWRKERRLGMYAAAEEMCLDLDEMEIAALQELKKRIVQRIREHVAAEAAGVLA
jgi:hypothetical protein